MGGYPDSSAGKESTSNGGDLGLIPGLGRSIGEGIGFPDSSAAKGSAYNVGDLGSIPGLGRSPGGRSHGNPLPCSGLENPMDYM